MQASTRDIAAGAIFVAFGIAFGVASFNYDLGSAFRMGPGYMPLVLAGLLVVLGAAVAWSGRGRREAAEVGPIPWRGVVLIGAALFLFGWGASGLGLVPSVIAVAGLSALASRSNGALSALAIGLGMAVLATAVFWYGLSVPLPLVGPWLDLSRLGG